MESEKDCKIILNQAIQYLGKKKKSEEGEGEARGLIPKSTQIYSFPLCLRLLGSHLFQEVCKQSKQR